MSSPVYDPNQTSIGNALAGSEYGYATAPLIEDPASFAIQPTGKQANLEFLSQPYNEAWPDALKDEWEKYHMLGISTTPSAAAADMTAALKAERDSAAQAADPLRQAEVATARASMAANQAEVQQNYLQELQYQRHIATLNNPEATRAQRAAAINAIDGLAASIGQRMIKGTARPAIADAKRLVGTVSSRVPLVPVNVREYNPVNIVANTVFGADWNADYSAELKRMLDGSQERMGVLRQQMEAAGIPLPEAKQVEAAMNPPAPNLLEVSVQRLGVKAADGSQVMLNGAPVIRRKDGKLFKAMPNGKAVELTEQEIAQLGQ